MSAKIWLFSIQMSAAENPSNFVPLLFPSAHTSSLPFTARSTRMIGRQVVTLYHFQLRSWLSSFLMRRLCSCRALERDLLSTWLRKPWTGVIPRCSPRMWRWSSYPTSPPSLLISSPKWWGSSLLQNYVFWNCLARLLQSLPFGLGQLLCIEISKSWSIVWFFVYFHALWSYLFEWLRSEKMIVLLRTRKFICYVWVCDQLGVLICEISITVFSNCLQMQHKNLRFSVVIKLFISFGVCNICIATHFCYWIIDCCGCEL